MRNVSIAVGREASIDCHVSDADDYKVSFVNAMKILEKYRMPFTQMVYKIYKFIMI